MSIRTCVGCRCRKEKSELLRLVVSNGRLNVDPLGRSHGRGAYICPEKGCVFTACKRADNFSRAFRSGVVPHEPEELWRNLLQSLVRDK